MIHLATPAPNVLDVTLEGLVTGEDVAALRAALTDLMEADGRVSLVVDMGGFDDMTEKAALADLRLELSLLPRLRRVGRVALVADKRMLHALAGWADRFLPGTSVKAFPVAARAEAEAFAGEAASGPGALGPRAGLRMLPGGPDLIAYEITGPLGARAAEPVFERIAEAAGAGRKVDLLALIGGFEGFDPAILLDARTYRGKMDALRTVRRYAVVGGPAWMGWAVQAASAALPVETRRFEDEGAARAWLARGT